MKKTLIILILFFSSLVMADDISDFEIEGMSIGDSLLNYFSEEEIKKNTFFMYSYIEERKFTSVVFQPPNFTFKNYLGVQVDIKINDNKYIIYAITGKDLIKDINDCHKRQDNVTEELSIFFKGINKEGPYLLNHPADKSGKSKVRQIYFIVEGGGATIECSDWSEQMPYNDQFNVGVISNELDDWLQ